MVALLAGAVAVTLGLGTLARTVNTLRVLETVEAERDGWQRPAEVLAALEVGRGRIVADVGSGAGYFALKLARLVGDDGRVYAVDIRSLPLRFLRLRALLAGRGNISILEADVDDPHLPPEGIDAALVANTYHELAQPAKVLGHVWRALRPGARLVVVDPAPSAPTAWVPAPETHHHETAVSAEEEIRRAGFEVLRREDRFLAGPDGPWWLVVARRPPSRM